MTTPTSRSHEGAQETHLEYLTEEWIRLHEAYFAALQLKDKKMDSSIHDTEDLERSASFWNSFQELEDEAILEGNPAIKNITKNLVRRKNLQRGITCTEADLNKITAHPSMRMFTPADLRLEFELKATPFWREWDLFEHLIKNAPTTTTYLHLAETILFTHGKEG